MNGDLFMETVSYTTDSTFRITGREELFDYRGYRDDFGRIPYDVAEDGRFLLWRTEPDSPNRWRTVLVRNVFQELEEGVAGN